MKMTTTTPEPKATPVGVHKTAPNTVISKTTSTGVYLAAATTFTKGVQYAFFFDQSRCVSCNVCQIICKDWNNLPSGPGKWNRMFEWEDGSWPNVRMNFLYAPCYHCQTPVCVAACPNHAIYKEGDYGAVLIDPAVCKGARDCFEACPYGAITYRSDLIDPSVQAQKCTMCIDRLDQGQIPICVASCPMKALDFGTLSDLQSKYGKLQQLPGMPDPSTTNPSIVFKPRDAKKQLVPYDSAKVLALAQQRIGVSGNPLPNLFNSTTDVTDVSDPTLVTHSQLKMKASNVDEAIKTTVNFD